jgi:hypothetical protein
MGGEGRGGERGKGGKEAGELAPPNTKTKLRLCPRVHLSAGSLVRGFSCPQTCNICRVGRNNGGIV